MWKLAALLQGLSAPLIYIRLFVHISISFHLSRPFSSDRDFLSAHPAHLSGSRCNSTLGSQVRGQGSSTERRNDVQTRGNWPILQRSVWVCAWRQLNGWKETVHQWEIWKQFDCIRPFKASPLISPLASPQGDSHTHAAVCVSGRINAQKAFHNYAFIRLFDFSFTHLFINLFLSPSLGFDLLSPVKSDEIQPAVHIAVAKLQHRVLTALLVLSLLSSVLCRLSGST